MSANSNGRTPPGFLNMHKPSGMTSYDVIRELKEALPEGVHIGHGGTLDKPAEGILPVGLGRATKLFEYFPFMAKTYRGTVLFGVETDTHDLNGDLTGTDPDTAAPAAGEVEELLEEHFTGIVEQIPPQWSSLKQGGKALYRHKQKGEEVEPDPRPVEFFRTSLMEIGEIAAGELRREIAEREEGPELEDAELPENLPLVHLEVTCGGGTYLRSLARDLGALCGTVSTLYSLTRTAVGPFTEGWARTGAEVQAELRDTPLHEVLSPMRWGANPDRTLSLEDQEIAALLQGQMQQVDARRVGFKVGRYYPEHVLQAWEEMPESRDPRDKRTHEPYYCLDPEGRLKLVCEQVGESFSDKINLKIRKNMRPEEQ